MFASGIVVLSFPVKSSSRIVHYLKNASRFVENVLYVKLEPNAVTASKCIPIHQETVPSKNDLITVVPNIYRIASKTIPSIDVRVLLNRNLRLKFTPEVLFTDCKSNGEEYWINYAHNCFNIDLKAIKFLEKSASECDGETKVNNEPCRSYNNVCLGGTFDGLHNGHKVLLNEAVLRCKQSLTVGVTDIEMISRKILWELIEPVECRAKALRHYLEDIDNSLKYVIVPINDPLGPAVEDPTLECLLVSEETVKGGHKVNEVRKSKNMSELDLIVVDLVKENFKQNAIEEDKVSSSTGRLRKLGQLLRPPEPRPHLSSRPYLIGLTGGIASGKTHICDKMKSLGAGVINCDLLAHETYSNQNNIAFKKIVEAFGKAVLNENSFIDRKKLGSIVFENQEKLNLLNSIVWPATSALVEEKINEMKKTHDIIVLEAAVLLEANWQSKVHEVWVSIIPEDEAVTRLQERNKFSEEEAKKRISSQITNPERVGRSNVVFCSLWDYNYTESQVEVAWRSLLERIKRPVN